MLKVQYENKLTDINNQLKKPHNEREAGRKRKATKEVIKRVMVHPAQIAGQIGV